MFIREGDCVLSDWFSFQQLSLQVFFLWPPEVLAARRKHFLDFRANVAHGFDHPGRRRKQPTVSFLTGSFFQQLSFQVGFSGRQKFFARRKHLLIALHYATLRYATQRYTTLHYTQHNTTLHHTTLHSITLHFATLPHITLHYTTLHYITLRYTRDTTTNASATTLH